MMRWEIFSVDVPPTYNIKVNKLVKKYNINSGLNTNLFTLNMNSRMRDIYSDKELLNILAMVLNTKANTQPPNGQHINMGISLLTQAGQKSLSVKQMWWVRKIIVLNLLTKELTYDYDKTTNGKSKIDITSHSGEKSDLKIKTGNASSKDPYDYEDIDF